MDESRRRELDGVQGAVIQPFEEFLSTLPRPIDKTGLRVYEAAKSLR